MFNAPPVVIALIAVLVGVHALVHLLPSSWTAPAQVYLYFNPSHLAAFETYPFLISARWVGHAFMHHDWMHLLVNCGFLLAFGTPVARQVPVSTFLILFAAGAAAGAGLTTMVFGEVNFNLIGASGAVSALLGALARMMVLRRRGEILPRPFDSARNGLIFIAVIIGINLLIGFIPGPDGTRISGESHIGGFLAGFVLSLILPWRKHCKGAPAND